jgi:hypothetical protein
MNKPSLCGFASLEHFKKHTTYLVEKGCLHLLKEAADTLAAEQMAAWESYQWAEANEIAALDRWMEENHRETKGV